MRFDMGIVIGVIIEYIFFMLYSGFLFGRKRDKLFCYTITAAGYLLQMVSCMFGNVYINTTVFSAINFISLLLCFNTDIKTALFQTILLSVAMVSSEYFLTYIFNDGISPERINNMDSIKSIILTAASRPIYMFELMILTYIFKKGKRITGINSWLMMAIPALTVIILISAIIGSKNMYMCLIICFAVVSVDIIVFFINQRLVEQAAESDALRLRMKASEAEYIEYERIRVLRHDIREHMNAVYSLLEDGSERAKEYIEKLYFQPYGSEMIRYSDNDMFNIVISKKKQECKQHGINLIIEPIRTSLKFIDDTDTVSIFSNLMNNAIESCIVSNEKSIYLDVFCSNNAFTVIKIENSAETPPRVIDGRLVTSKGKGLHGIGMKSVKNAVEKYGGDLEWEYKQKRFCVYLRF